MREEERQLIHRMAAGDPNASYEFVEQWSPRIERWVSQRATDEKVEDYAQEVWAHLIAGNWLRLLQWNGLDNDEDWHQHSLEAFLKRVTINKVKDLQAAEPPTLPPGLDPVEIIDRTTPYGRDPLVEAERSRLIMAFNDCARWFKERDDRLISMWWEGHTAQHIGEQLEMNPNNVYQRRSYLLKQLRDCLVEKLPEYFRHV